MDESASKPPSKNTWLAPVSLVVFAVLVVIAFMAFRKERGPGALQVVQNSGDTLPKLARNEALTLLQLRDRAVASLENGDYETADALLLQIIKQLPDDPFGPRNLTICRELALQKFDQMRDAAKTELAKRKALDASNQLGAIEPKSHIPHVLSARIALLTDNPESATQSLKRASELAPQAAPVWYDLFLLKPVAPGEPPAPETVSALRKVYELEPDNLFVLKDWLPLQVQLKDADLGKTISRARETLDPFADVIKSHIRIDVRELLDKLTKAVEAGQWPVATSTSMVIRNIIVAEAARDERFVHWNTLEYSLLDFGPRFYERADLPPKEVAAIPVKFTNGGAPISIPAGARDLVIADFNLDGKLDGISLTELQAVITSPLQPAEGEMATRQTVDMGEGFSNLVAVDLDDDVDPKLKDRPRDSINCPLADPDLIVFGPAGIRLYENQATAADAERKFVEKPAGESLAALRHVRAVVPGDLDLDGDLDFVTVADRGVQLFSNRGNWQFDDITGRSKLPPDTFAPSAAVTVDWDRDTDLDILVAGAEGIGILESMRHGRFRWRLLDKDFQSLKGASELLVEQIGPRESWSLIGAGPGGIHVALTQTSTGGVVSALGPQTTLDGKFQKAAAFDFDNDGQRDLLAFGDGQVALYRGLSDGNFESKTAILSGDIASLNENRGLLSVAVCDIDHDGDEDLCYSTKTSSGWASNDGGNANGWLDVALLAIQIKQGEQNYSKRANHCGIGSVIELKSGLDYQAQVVRGASTRFGLGPRQKADVMRIVWTNGIPLNQIDPVSNQRICEEQKLHGSCPYLYTWDGEKFVFFTDLLWNAPLGLKFAEDVVAPWREWEYLKIDGEKLKPKDGHYPLRVTAELWEVEYFDQIKLFAVDHPAGTDIFTNEKVGPPSLAEPKIHTVSRPRAPIAARDSLGRDVLDQVIRKDGIYTQTYDRKIAQGLTNEHYLELDLGSWNQPVSAGDSTEQPAPRKPVVTLYLTGWMYPGSTSLSVQHSQNPEQSRQRPPALHAVDENGQWREVQPFMGFPGGKTKTIAVDLTDVFDPRSADHRLRIVTNMEFYWDSAFFTVDDLPVEFVQTELKLDSAKLVDRGGVSLRRWPESGNGPEIFDYDQRVTGEMWPPIEGRFTRFGDVRPLLTERDDQLVVMHPGDEIQMEFVTPATPVPQGWVRDFVIYNVGWDKDCDLNTVAGESSEPLPFQGMTVYALREGEARPLDQDYVRYLKTYQTRTRVRSQFWNRLTRN